MKSKLEIDMSGVDDVFKRLRKELGHGKHGANAGFLSDDKRKDGKLTEDKVALYNEFGTKDIPARPFMRRAHKVLKNKIPKMVQAGLEDEKSLEQILGECGQAMRNEIIESIDSNIPPPNKESTIKRKGSTHTLIDTGQMRRAVHTGIVLNSKEKLKE